MLIIDQLERPIQNVSTNYHEPGPPGTTYLVHNTNYMNNIFMPVIDWLHLDLNVVGVPTYVHRAQGARLLQTFANDCYKLSLLKESLPKQPTQSFSQRRSGNSI